MTERGDREAPTSAEIMEMVRRAFADGAIWGVKSIRLGLTGEDMGRAARDYAWDRRALARGAGAVGGVDGRE